MINADSDGEIVPPGLAEKLPRTNLVPDGEFTFNGLPKSIDFTIAQSVFTYMHIIVAYKADLGAVRPDRLHQQ